MHSGVGVTPNMLSRIQPQSVNWGSCWTSGCPFVWPHAHVRSAMRPEHRCDRSESNRGFSFASNFMLDHDPWRMLPSVIVRELRRRHDLWLARALTTSAALVLLAVLMADQGPFRTCLPVPGLCLPEWPPTTMSYIVVMAVMLLAALGPWLVTRSRGRLVRVELEGDRVVIGGRALARDAAVAVSMARARRGVSLAVEGVESLAVEGVEGVEGTRRRRYFEVESEAAARAIASRLSTPAPPRPSSRAAEHRPNRDVFARITLSVVQLLAALGYLGAVLFDGPIDKTVAGVTAVVVAQLLAIETWVRRADAGAQRRVKRPTRFDEHEALHRDPERRVDLSEDPSADAPALGAREAHERAATDKHDDESTAAWLARLDGMGGLAGGAYRSPVADRQALMELLRSEPRDVEEKIAAARLLRVAYGDDPRVFARIVADPDERARVETAELEAEAAAERLEALGPLFRAR